MRLSIVGALLSSENPGSDPRNECSATLLAYELLAFAFRNGKLQENVHLFLHGINRLTAQENLFPGVIKHVYQPTHLLIPGLQDLAYYLKVHC